MGILKKYVTSIVEKELENYDRLALPKHIERAVRIELDKQEKERSEGKLLGELLKECNFALSNMSWAIPPLYRLQRDDTPAKYFHTKGEIISFLEGYKLNIKE